MHYVLIVLLTLTLWSPLQASDPVCVKAEQKAERASSKSGSLAMALMRGAQKKCPNSAKITYLMARWYDRQGRYEPAIDFYRQTLGMNPEHMQAIGRLGELFALNHQFGKAAATLSLYAGMLSSRVEQEPELQPELDRVLARLKHAKLAEHTDTSLESRYTIEQLISR